MISVVDLFYILSSSLFLAVLYLFMHKALLLYIFLAFVIVFCTGYRMFCKYNKKLLNHLVISIASDLCAFFGVLIFLCLIALILFPENYKNKYEAANILFYSLFFVCEIASFIFVFYIRKTYLFASSLKKIFLVLIFVILSLISWFLVTFCAVSYLW